MAARLLLRSAVRAATTCRASPVAALSRGMATGGIPTDEEQATGLEKEDYACYENRIRSLQYSEAQGVCRVKSDPTLYLLSPTKELSAVSVRRTTQLWCGSGCMKVNPSCPSCGSHYKLVPHELPH